MLSLTGPLAPDATLLSYSNYIVPRNCGCQEAKDLTQAVATPLQILERGSAAPCYWYFRGDLGVT